MELKELKRYKNATAIKPMRNRKIIVADKEDGVHIEVRRADYDRITPEITKEIVNSVLVKNKMTIVSLSLSKEAAIALLYGLKEYVRRNNILDEGISSE